MWLVPVTVFVVCAVALIVWLGRGPASDQVRLLWDIPRVAGTYTSIVGTLAGFSVTSTIFLANLSASHPSPEFTDVMGMFLIAFLIFMGTAMMFGTTPNSESNPAQDRNFLHIQRVSYVVANLGYYLGIAVSWVALRPLLLGLHLDALADILHGCCYFPCWRVGRA